jgi:hypothetical protein
MTTSEPYGPLDVYAHLCSRSTAWAARFRPRRSARCCEKRSGRQIGDHLGKPFADFGISRPLSGLGALLGIAQIYLAASDLMERLMSMSIVEPHTCGGRCLTLAQSMPWFGHTVQNRATGIDALAGNVAY